jgi:hypothetical protein
MMSGEDDGQPVLAFIEADKKAGQGITGYEYAVRVTHTNDEILSLGQLYRDRADTDNAFDELKNQWDGAASPRMICTVAHSLPELSRGCITGGASSSVWRIRKLGARRLPAGFG